MDGNIKLHNVTILSGRTIFFISIVTILLFYFQIENCFVWIEFSIHLDWNLFTCNCNREWRKKNCKRIYDLNNACVLFPDGIDVAIKQFFLFKIHFEVKEMDFRWKCRKNFIWNRKRMWNSFLNVKYEIHKLQCSSQWCWS